jgi:PAS domain S-box-containing protein
MNLELDKKRLEYILDFLPDAMFAIDKEGRVIQWNRALEDLTGVLAKDIIGKGDYEVAVPFYGYKRPVLAHYAMEIDKGDIEKNYSTIKREGNILIAEVYVPFPGYRKEGAWLWGRAAPLYDENGEIIGAVEVVRDITERKKLEEERLFLERRALESEKHKTIEVLAAGVAHDFNNILMAILGYADIIQNSADNLDIIRKGITEIKKAVMRGSELSQQMLRFAGKAGGSFENIDIKQIIREIADLIRVSIPPKIEISLDLPVESIAIYADPTQIKQVILNLLLNSADAIGTNAGNIRIRVERVFLNGEFIYKELPRYRIAEGDYVKISVIDNGCGMDGETLRYIFEPFFSTKFAGRGLGLAEVEGIVRLHNGGIRIESEKGKGSVFEVFIPSGRGVPVQRDELKVDVKGDICFSGYVLVVDDDDAVRQSLKSMFTKLGMEVIVASNGEEALTIYREPGIKIDLVCADILMPKMDGIELLREIRKIDRNQRAILISGYTGDRINLTVLDESITRFIKKPFEIQHLIDVISDLMGRSST